MKRSLGRPIRLRAGMCCVCSVFWVALAGCQGEADPAPVDRGATDAFAIDPGSDVGPDVAPPIELDFVRIEGGEFMMGSEAFANAQPVHPVTVPGFEMSRHEVTLAQYAVCQRAGVCAAFTEAQIDACRLDERVSDEEPVRCIHRDDALVFAQWARARLPSEAEWEFAATSRGTRHPYPWGDAAADCDHAVMVLAGDPEGGLIDEDGCGQDRPWPVCSMPAGNTEEGLCDMAGNVAEWVADDFCDYPAGPRGAEPLRCAGADQLHRGGSYGGLVALLSVSARGGTVGPTTRLCQRCGFRLARDAD